MMRIIGVDSSVTDPLPVNEDSTVDKIGNNKVDRTKVGIKTAKSKSKNFVKLFSTKSQSFTQGSGLSFFTPKARQAFTNLRQAFIEILILHSFDLNCHICIKINVSSYVIDKILSQLT